MRSSEVTDSSLRLPGEITQKTREITRSNEPAVPFLEEGEGCAHIEARLREIGLNILHEGGGGDAPPLSCSRQRGRRRSRIHESLSPAPGRVSAEEKRRALLGAGGELGGESAGASGSRGETVLPRV